MPKQTHLNNTRHTYYPRVMLPRALGASTFKAASQFTRLPSTTAARFSTMSNITLYTWPTPNGIKASITLEELGLPYKTESIDISTNIQKEECVTPPTYPPRPTDNNDNTDGS